ncbi:MAG TPA: transposase [Blastocatellia bacterium]|nr:transposase [Blastocatellia bacterium]
MPPKWSNRNLPGALHFVTSAVAHRRPIFTRDKSCQTLIDVLSELRPEWPFRLIAYVLMPDHFHLIVNPRDGRIRELTAKLKGVASRRIISLYPEDAFEVRADETGRQIRELWQQSFKDIPLWSDWMIWQKINYIHANPLKARMVSSAADYRWSSFRSFYLADHNPIQVDKDWWWPDDVRKLAVAAKDWSQELWTERKR